MKAIAYLLALIFTSIYVPPLHAQVPGGVDAGFNPNVNSTVYCTALQPDGGIVLGGTFTSVGGSTHAYVGRINSNGTPDVLFNHEADLTVNNITIQADGKILLGGHFAVMDGMDRRTLARLN